MAANRGLGAICEAISCLSSTTNLDFLGMDWSNGCSCFCGMFEEESSENRTIEEDEPRSAESEKFQETPCSISSFLDCFGPNFIID